LFLRLPDPLLAETVAQYPEFINYWQR